MLAVRNLDKGKDAAARIAAKSPNADVTLQELDLTSLDAIRKASDDLRAAYPRIDLLINNAGVMYTPKETTKDGFELQFGTNHLGHFALTGQLLDNMLPVEGSRVVTISSHGHRMLARIDFDDLQAERGYNRVARLRAVEAGQPAVHLRAGAPAGRQGRADHRGGRPPRRLQHRTHPQSAGIDSTSPPSSCGRWMTQSAEMGALPTLRAATDPGVRNAQYYGPDGIGEQRGHPKLVESSAQSHDEEIQRRLWTVSEELTGVTYPV